MCWICKNRVFYVEGSALVSPDELTLRIQHSALKQEKEFARMQREVQAFENLSLVAETKRERIPEDVRLFVWQRDEGKCVRCHSNRNLEFDHIIPVIEGGSSTSRNIQLLCETCNRGKRKVNLSPKQIKNRPLKPDWYFEWGGQPLLTYCDKDHVPNPQGGYLPKLCHREAVSESANRTLLRCAGCLPKVDVFGIPGCSFAY